jgi:hypothetical protein
MCFNFRTSNSWLPATPRQQPAFTFRRNYFGECLEEFEHEAQLFGDWL